MAKDETDTILIYIEIEVGFANCNVSRAEDPTHRYTVFTEAKLGGWRQKMQMLTQNLKHNKELLCTFAWNIAAKIK